MDLIVLAKEPRPGRVKTRLCPPCTSEQAAAIAEAALADTLQAAMASGADRVVVALDGAPGPWCPSGVEIVDQGGGDLGQRLDRAWSHARGPALQIGMDTPQLRAVDLDDALALLARSTAVLGPATDGGWWGLGLHRPRAGAFDGVPMSTEGTGAAQRDRLRSLGLDPVPLPELADVDHWATALDVAAAAPDGRFADIVAAVARTLASTVPA